MYYGVCFCALRTRATAAHTCVILLFLQDKILARLQLDATTGTWQAYVIANATTGMLQPLLYYYKYFVLATVVTQKC
jgi:hypothetical protein